MKRRAAATIAGLLLLGTLAGCSRSEPKQSAQATVPSQSTVGTAGHADCTSTKPQATDIGVTADQIVIEVSADTGSPLAPGLFQSNVDALNGFAKYVNDHGGLACRKLVVKAWDSKLNADESKNGQADACTNALAMVGSNSLFNPDMSTLVQCRDASGAATGLPDIAAAANDANQQCSPTTFLIQPINEDCSGPRTGLRSFNLLTGFMRYFTKQTPDLHGIYLIPGDLPSTIQNSMGLVQALKESGVKLDATTKISGRDQQVAYTPRLQTIKNNNSNFVFDGANDRAMISVRKEARAQGVDTVKVWLCSFACYTKNLLSVGGADVEGTYVFLVALPFEEADTNAEMRAYLDSVGGDKADAFGAESWQAGLLFQKTIEQIVQRDGVNGITRKSVLAALNSVNTFDANGWIGAKPLRGPSPCFVIMQVRNGKFARVFPEKRGTMDCTPTNLSTIKLDPAAEAAKVQ